MNSIFSIPYTGVSRQTGKKTERERFMNGLQGSDLVPGTCGDTLMVEEGGGVVRGFLVEEVMECWER